MRHFCVLPMSWHTIPDWGNVDYEYIFPQTHWTKSLQLHRPVKSIWCSSTDWPLNYSIWLTGELTTWGHEVISNISQDILAYIINARQVVPVNKSPITHDITTVRSSNVMVQPLHRDMGALFPLNKGQYLSENIKSLVTLWSSWSNILSLVL